MDRQTHPAAERLLPVALLTLSGGLQDTYTYLRRGKVFALAQGCDTFVTADLKYNNFLDAKALGLNLMDAGHFPTENVVCAPLARRLAEAFSDVEVVLSEVHREVYSHV